MRGGQKGAPEPKTKLLNYASARGGIIQKDGYNNNNNKTDIPKQKHDLQSQLQLKMFHKWIHSKTDYVYAL